MTLLCVVGARPNFMKMAALLPALREVAPYRLIHTGQHYDAAMKETFFRQLAIPEPDQDLGVGSGSHAVQTAEVMRRFEPVVEQVRPAAVVVVGDVNSTIACALVAVKLGVRVVHVEAGLRSYDRTMPEEINRVLTDQIADLLFTTERSAADNLAREGIPAARVLFVGNLMIDTLWRLRAQAPSPERLIPTLPGAAGFPAAGGAYGLVTLHRPANVDDPAVLERLLTTLNSLGRELPLLFPIHPRTRGRIEAAGLAGLLDPARLLPLPPLGYVENLGLMAGARVVLTDSGGIQEETTALGVACLTLRDNTERPITLTEGTNTLVGADPARMAQAFREVLAGRGKSGRAPELWDGQAAGRIATALREWLPAT